MICWCCHSNSVNTGSRLPICSDVKTRKRWNMVGIDMIRNNRIVTLLSQCITIQNTGCFDGVSSTFTWDTLWKIIMQGEFQQKHLSSVWLNSVCHEIVSYDTIVFYDKVQGRNKVQRWLLLVCCGFFIWKTGQYSCLH
jgi:hypothetical protein